APPTRLDRSTTPQRDPPHHHPALRRRRHRPGPATRRLLHRLPPPHRPQNARPRRQPLPPLDTRPPPTRHHHHNGAHSHQQRTQPTRRPGGPGPGGASHRIPAPRLRRLRQTAHRPTKEVAQRRLPQACDTLINALAPTGERRLPTSLLTSTGPKSSRPKDAR